MEIFAFLPERQGLDFPFADGGQVFLLSDQVPERKHAHVLIHFEDGSTLVYEDVRKFGTMELLAPTYWTPTLFLKN